MGPKNPNFDPAIRTGLNQFHCEDYQILIPMTIHGSKSELKQLRYPKNCKKCINTLLKAINFDQTVGYSISLVF